MYRRTRGISLTGVSPFARKLYRTYNEYFYFYFIPTWRVILTTIAVFLFTRWFRRIAILRINPSVYGIPCFRTSSWWLHVVGQVVVCGCVSVRHKQKIFRKLLRSRNHSSGNIIIRRPNNFRICFLYSWHHLWAFYGRLMGSPLKWESILENRFLLFSCFWNRIHKIILKQNRIE